MTTGLDYWLQYFPIEMFVYPDWGGEIEAVNYVTAPESEWPVSNLEKYRIYSQQGRVR